MGLNDVSSGERIHIGFFGLRNAGKSSVVNAVTGQDLAVVSDVKGTTTDPVKQSMELLPLGPVVLIDTPGFDDEGMLGETRVRATRKVLGSIDVAVLVVDGTEGLRPADRELMEMFRERRIPYLIAWNKADLDQGGEGGLKEPPADIPEEQLVRVSAVTGGNIHELKERIGHFARGQENQKVLVRDLLSPGDAVVLVIPIDKAAPKGRLILPEQMMIRDVLDARAVAVVTQEDRLAETLAELTRPPRMVITDSQAFRQVAEVLPEGIPLTSFSILMVRYKGELEPLTEGAAVLDELEPQDKVLISEGCTHHRQCGDIGTEKLPRLLNRYTGHPVQFDVSAGTGFPEDLTPYKLVIHCGGCMLNEREMHTRMGSAAEQGVPMTNYGVAIAKMNGILERSLELFPAVRKRLEK